MSMSHEAEDLRVPNRCLFDPHVATALRKLDAGEDVTRVDTTVATVRETVAAQDAADAARAAAEEAASNPLVAEGILSGPPGGDAEANEGAEELMLDMDGDEMLEEADGPAVDLA
jgi:hypothetical protein